MRTIKAGYARRRANRAEVIAAAQTETEVVSDFLPLTYAANRSGDGSQIVRVEMPRSALLTLGLPVSVELTGDRLKADVLVGNDGVALAIRFVQ